MNATFGWRCRSGPGNARCGGKRPPRRAQAQTLSLCPVRLDA
jgi:hypothetical protein